MKICMVLFSNGWGGAETVVYQLARRLIAHGERVFLVTNHEMTRYYSDIEGLSILDVGTRYPSLSAKLRKKSKEFKSGNAKRIVDLCRTYVDEILRYRRYRAARRRTGRFLLENGIEVVHSHLADADIFASLHHDSGVSLVTTIHGEHTLMRAESGHLLQKPMMIIRSHRHRNALERMSRVCTVSSFERNVLISYLRSIAEKVVVIGNGVENAGLQACMRSSMKLEGGFRLVFPGGAKKSKGGDVLLTALARVKEHIPDIHLYIALDVPDGHALRTMVKELGIEQNVTFAGFLPVKDYWRLLAGADLFVLPARVEAFSIASLEAMALGKPIVAGKTGGIPEVVKEGRNGILVPPEPISLAEAILRIYRNPNLRAEFSMNNVADAAMHDWEKIVSKYIDLYSEMSRAQN